MAGIGGSTVEEVKKTLSVEEFKQWVEWRNANGPLVGSWRIENQLALLALIQSKMAGDKKSVLEDFIIHPIGLPSDPSDTPSDEATDINAVFTLLQGVVGSQ